jgi:ABC-2 type transport system permease protein
MRKMMAIYRKEVRIAFTTPVAYIALSIFSIVAGFFFCRLLADFQGRVMVAAQTRPLALKYLNLTDDFFTPLILNVCVVFIFVVPLITMGSIAAERRFRTHELLRACPVTPFQVVMGKYLGVMTIVMAMLILTGALPLLLAVYAKGAGPEWPSVATGLGGLFLAGAAFSAIGLFISSLTKSQIVAAIVTFCSLLMLWVTGWAAGDSSGLTRDVLQGIGATEHMRNFAKGVVDSRDVVYYLTLAVFFVFLTQRSLTARDWS